MGYTSKNYKTNNGDKLVIGVSEVIVLGAGADPDNPVTFAPSFISSSPPITNLSPLLVL